MKKFYAFLVIIFFSIYTNAQSGPTATPSPNAAQPAVTQQSPAANSPNTPEGAIQREVTDAPPIEPSANSPFNLPPEKKNPVKIPKFETSPVIDGKLDDDIWKTAPILKDFFQTSPGDNIRASKPTEVMLGYDEKHLYIAFKCYDERDKIRATLAKRDNVFGEDNVRVWLDTYNDQRRAYILGFNPLGIQQDGIYTEGQGGDFSVDIVMESKGVIEDWGWSVEVKIPFKSLRYAAGKGKFWGFNAARNIDRLNDEFDSWLPDNRNISGFLVKHGKVTGLDEIKTERTLEVVPSITLSETGNRRRNFPLSSGFFDTGRFVNERIKKDIGVNLKFNITPNITLDAAFNPDYAEIEADAPVVTANQRFPIFFQEKRPFFLEGSEIFQSPIQVFYSRTIVDPDAAVKLTGKIGRTSFGFLAASDNAPGNYSEDERNDLPTRQRIDEFVDKNATFAVLRLKQDVGKENNVGFYATARMFPEQKNILAGFDGRFKLNPKTTSQFQVLGTHSRRCFFSPTFESLLEPLQAQRNREICGTGSTNRTNSNPNTYNNYRTGNGLGYYWNLDYTEKNRGFYAEASGRTRDYRSDAGFTRRTNTNSIFIGGRFSTEPKPKAKIIRIDWRPGVSTNYDWQGRSLNHGLSSNFSFNFQRNTSANLQTGVYYERIFEEEFGLKRGLTRGGAFFGAPERSTWQNSISANINSSPIKQISLGLFAGTITNAFDFDFGGGARFPRVSPAALAGSSLRDPGAGRQYDFGAGIEVRPTDPFRISLNYNKSHLTRNDTGLTTFDSNIFTVRSTYQFTRFAYIRARWDYDSISSNARGQVLFGYNPSPGTAFYAGYNDNFNYNGFNPFTGQLEPRFERNSRTFFIRASYLFRKSF
ncbi:MAG: carbohydrate binding family 9 domain-containing protein [Acidobacteria bacterium]|nr:carbohydrate binding family 9 domain-containing protein [Acidobacteriota bacterium]